MIIVIGKKDRASMMDAQAYVHQYGELMLKEQWVNPDSAKIIDEDCQNIANRILKALGKKLRHK
jgi:hypothetical protein